MDWNRKIVEPERSGLELADVFRLYGKKYRQTHYVSKQQARVMKAIEQCRTAALGGHIDECDQCRSLIISYNSCRNRHCPKCQYSQQLRWVEARKAELLPIEYFHLVFTLPHQLNPVARYNQALIYDLLFRAASQTLLEFGANNLGGELGITAVLHTWGQNLSEHIHLHCIVTGGVLAKDGSRWRSSAKGFLFPVKAMSKVFGGKYRAMLRVAYGERELKMETEEFGRIINELSASKWVVYAKKPFAGAEQVLEYIGRYTHRVAISNQRIVAIEDGQVSFLWKDYRDAEKMKVMKLEADEFIRRFLLHVLPAEFVRIRHYGLLASRYKKEKIEKCRELIIGRKQQQVETASVESRDLEFSDSQEQGKLCPNCGKGQMVRKGELPRGVGPPNIEAIAKVA
jgi:hypothetical protein